MGILQDLGIDAIGEVHLDQEGWQVAALRMIENRRKQVTAAHRRVKTERHEEALIAELKRLANLENYVRACQNGLPAPSERNKKLVKAALASATWEELRAMAA